MKKFKFYSPIKPESVLIILVVLLFASCQVSNQFKALELSKTTVASIDSICKLSVDKGHYPGLAIAVVEKGKKEWTKGYGYADIESKRPINPSDDLFRIGSISKTITASALARLVEKGSLSLDKPISGYYHGFPPDKDSITLRQLGGHKAGIRHYNGIEFLSDVHYSSIEDALEVFIHDTLLYKPGTDYKYSTYGFTLISKVMESGTGIPFLKIIKDEVQTPLHLADLKPDITDSTRYHRVQFYDFQDDHIVVSPHVDLSNKWAGGGMLCSAEDLARFGYALTGPGYLDAGELEEFTKSQSLPNGKKTNYGIGFRIGKDDDGKLWYGHSGGSVGGTSMLLIYPEEDLTIVTLVNLTGAEMNDLAMRIAAIVRKTSEKPKG